MDRNVSRRGVTLIELIIFIAIFTASMVGFVTILTSITGVQVRQVAVAEVNGQTQFLLQTLQYYIERSSLIELPANATTSTLKLRMSATSEDPTYIQLSNGVVYLKQTEAGVLQPLTSNKVSVSRLDFTKRANVSGHDTVAIVLSMDYATANLKQQFSQALRTSIARVTAATFDSNIVASSTNTYKIGTTAGEWQSINSTIYFGGSGNGNVGIGPTLSSPQARLEIDGGVRLNTTDTRPTCSSAQRGTLWFTQNTGATDTLSICVRQSDNSTYTWRSL